MCGRSAWPGTRKLGEVSKYPPASIIWPQNEPKMLRLQKSNCRLGGNAKIEISWSLPLHQREGTGKRKISLLSFSVGTTLQSIYYKADRVINATCMTSLDSIKDKNSSQIQSPQTEASTFVDEEMGVGVGVGLRVVREVKTM